MERKFESWKCLVKVIDRRVEIGAVWYSKEMWGFVAESRKVKPRDEEAVIGQSRIDNRDGEIKIKNYFRIWAETCRNQKLNATRELKERTRLQTEDFWERPKFSRTLTFSNGGVPIEILRKNGSNGSTLAWKLRPPEQRRRVKTKNRRNGQRSRKERPPNKSNAIEAKKDQVLKWHDRWLLWPRYPSRLRSSQNPNSEVDDLKCWAAESFVINSERKIIIGELSQQSHRNEWKVSSSLWKLTVKSKVYDDE